MRKVLEKHDEVESELRKICFWDDSLDEEAVREQVAALAAETGRSPVGRMPFEAWLQVVFLPNARTAARDNSLPDSSQVGLMAMREYDYHSHVPEAMDLLRLLREFDAIITGTTDWRRPLFTLQLSE